MKYLKALGLVIVGFVLLRACMQNPQQAGESTGEVFNQGSEKVSDATDSGITFFQALGGGGITILALVVIALLIARKMR